MILDDPEQRFEIHHESEQSEPGCIAWVFAADADDMYSEARANARLIAASPDLLAVAKQTLLTLDGHRGVASKDGLHVCAYCHLAAQIETAIAKAHGEASDAK